MFPGRYYIELQRLGRPGEEHYIAAAVALASRRNLPVVATNPVCFLKQDDFESHEARVCIHDGALLADPGRVRRYSQQQYLRSPQEMAVLFADVPEALVNSVQIARRCSLVLNLGEARLPPYPVPGGITTEDFIRVEAANGLEKRLAIVAEAQVPHYRERLEARARRHLSDGLRRLLPHRRRLHQLGEASNGIPVGPGRGSGAGSLVAYASASPTSIR